MNEEINPYQKFDEEIVNNKHNLIKEEENKENEYNEVKYEERKSYLHNIPKRFRKLTEKKSILKNSILISNSKKYHLTKANFVAFITSLVVYIIYYNMTKVGENEYPKCKDIMLRSTQLTRVYFYITLCYLISILSNIFESYYSKEDQHLIYDISSTVFSFVGTIGQFLIEIV